MKILQLYSDWRWTGPAEPVLQACKALQDRGHEVLIAVRRAEQDEVKENMERKAAEYNIPCTTQFGLNRYLSPGDTLRDIWELPRFLAREHFDILHVNLCHDHVFGAICAKMLGAKRPRIVRSLFRRLVLKDTLGYRLQMRQLSDGLLVFTPSFREGYKKRFNLDDKRVRQIPMVIDTNRFRPQPPKRDIRAELGIPETAPVIGLVTRFQRYRRMELFFNAAAAVVQAEPETRFVLLGGSGQLHDTVILPMKRLGLEDRVILGGYRMDDYVDTLATFDIFSLLMPGFDGTARAVREAMAMGIPSVVSDFGMLPEIIKDGETGLVAPLEVEPLAAAWLSLIRDRERRLNMGRAARKEAEKRFQLHDLGIALEDAYRQWAYANGDDDESEAATTE